MYAVIKTGGKQHRVAVGDRLSVEKLPGAKGEEVVFDQVLMVGSAPDTRIGRPILAGAKVVGEILSQFKGPKIDVFRMKRRKGYKKKTGHRQELTRMTIKKIEIT